MSGIVGTCSQVNETHVEVRAKKKSRPEVDLIKAVGEQAIANQADAKMVSDPHRFGNYMCAEMRFDQDLKNLAKKWVEFEREKSRLVEEETRLSEEAGTMGIAGPILQHRVEAMVQKRLMLEGEIAYYQQQIESLSQENKQLRKRLTGDHSEVLGKDIGNNESKSS